jgi:hypothetical protein
MPSRPAASCADTASRLDRARRVLRQQLDALSRLAVVAWRLIDPVAAAAKPGADPFGMAAVRGLEKALRLQARVVWAQRLIAALRDRLLAELQAVENGEAPGRPGEAGDVAPDPEQPVADAAPSLADKKDRAERAERRERLERERFGFEGRASDREIAEILKRPTAEIIALICRELGLPEDWPRLAEDAWSREAVDDTVEPSYPPPELSPGPMRTRAPPS